jgi:hypothetical protein
VGNRYAALVKGCSAIFPRGYLWVVPVWYAAIAVLIRVRAKLPSWYAPYALTATLLAVLALAPLAPPTVSIAVRRTWRARALGRLRRSRLTTAA